MIPLNKRSYFLEPNALESVAQFHDLFRCPVLETPTLPSSDRSKLRVSLLKEEVQELKDAIEQNDLVEVADALADIQYVLSGAVLEFGMGGIFLTLFDEVHRSNMSKACSTINEAEETKSHYLESKDTESFVERAEDGKWLVYRKDDRKVLKSIRYSPADLAGIMKKVQAKQSRPRSPSLQLLASPAALSSVAEFHTLFQCPVVDSPAMPSLDRCKLRVALLEEEVQELEDAVQQNDLVEVADALADIQYVLSGAVLEFGMGSIFHSLFDEVHRSNMSKACATPEEAEETRRHYRESKATDSYMECVKEGKWLVYRQGDNKALKSIRYSPADLGGILIQPEVPRFRLTKCTQ